MYRVKTENGIDSLEGINIKLVDSYLGREKELHEEFKEVTILGSKEIVDKFIGRYGKEGMIKSIGKSCKYCGRDLMVDDKAVTVTGLYYHSRCFWYTARQGCLGEPFARAASIGNYISYKLRADIRKFIK